MQRYAAALGERLGREEEAVRLPREAVGPILDLARVVAHGTERKNAPLASYLAGRYAAAREAEGIEPATALAEALAVAEALFGEQEEGGSEEG